MSSTLLVLSNNYRTLLLESEGENTSEIEELERQLVDKADACAFVLDDFEAYEKFLATKIAELQDLKRRIVAARERLKARIKIAMETLGTNEIRGDLWSFKTYKCVPKWDVNMDLLPDSFKIEKVTRVANYEKIEEDLKDGFEVPGVLITGGIAIRKTLNTKKRVDTPQKPSAALPSE